MFKIIAVWIFFSVTKFRSFIKVAFLWLQWHDETDYYLQLTLMIVCPNIAQHWVKIWAVFLHFLFVILHLSFTYSTHNGLIFYLIDLDLAFDFVHFLRSIFGCRGFVQQPHLVEMWLLLSQPSFVELTY